MTIVDRDAAFWSKVDNKSSDECWPFKGHIGENGYGQFWNGHRVVNAHRYAFKSFYGSIPKDKIVCHNCDNRSCCNPFHLTCATQKFNVQDCKQKGRSNDLAKLHPKFYAGELWLIRKLKHKVSRYIASKMFKCSKYTISKIWNSEKYLCKELYYVDL
jgi:hypothetical protein